MPPDSLHCPVPLCRCRRAAVLLASLVVVPAATGSQPYPVRPVRLVVPYAPGGANDILARLLGTRLGEVLGQPFVIDNRPGAAGNIGAGMVARATPDGHTLLMGGAGTLTTNPSLYDKVPFDTLKDFAPIVLVAGLSQVIVLHPSVPAHSVADLIALARAKPGQLTFASAGIGTPGHLGGELFKSMAGIDLLHVPYKGGGATLPDLLGGKVHLSFDNLSVTLPFIRGGRLRGLAVTGARRSAVLPELPTVAEAGVPGFEVSGWWGMLAPAATPRAVVERLSTESVRLLRQPDTLDRLTAQGYEPIAEGSAAFAQHLRRELARWPEIIRRSGARAS